MLNDWECAAPGRKETMFQALGRVTPSHLLDSGLFDFKPLTGAGSLTTGAAPTSAPAVPA
jgi:tRNA 2-thiocytidine biosynthesis protein TtcA